MWTALGLAREGGRGAEDDNLIILRLGAAGAIEDVDGAGDADESEEDEGDWRTEPVVAFN